MENNTDKQLREEAFRKNYILPAAKEAYPEKRLLDWENMNKQYAFEKGAVWMRKQSLSELEEAKKEIAQQQQAINRAAAIMYEKDKEIERLKAALPDVWDASYERCKWMNTPNRSGTKPPNKVEFINNILNKKP